MTAAPSGSEWLLTVWRTGRGSECDIGLDGHILACSGVLGVMTRPSPISPDSLALERPVWLTQEVWPFPVAAIDVDGHRVAFTDTGGDGRVVLFCHIGMWSLRWRDVMIDMSKTSRCITLDTPGVGLSSIAVIRR